MYDVIIAGAGIPGLYLARELARKNINVILIDSGKKGEPNYSTAGIPIETHNKFKLPSAGINETINTIICGTSDIYTKKVLDHNFAYVLDFKKQKYYLQKKQTCLEQK